MKNTAPQAEWRQGSSDKELAALLQQLRNFANFRHSRKEIRQTTDGTSTEIWSESMPTNCAWHVEYLIQGRSSTGDAARYRESKLLKRAAAAPSVVGTTTHEAPYEDDASWDFTFTAASDGTISLAVSGVAATTIDWVAVVSVLQVPRGS